MTNRFPEGSSPNGISEDAETRALLMTILCAAAGFAVWAGISVAAGGEREGEFYVREAWDTPAYFWLGLPLLALAAGIAGYIAPGRSWRWPLWIVAGQAVAMIFVHPAGTSLALLPLTALFAGLPLLALLTLPTALGRILGRLIKT